MTPEEKVKAYDEAFKKAKRLYDGKDKAPEEPILEYLFPQLNESEDERIRKEIINFLETIPISELKRVPRPICQWFFWLEKQKEPKHAPDELQKSFEAGQTSIVDNPEQYGLCKKAEWSEEDEKILHGIEQCVYENVANIGTADKVKYIDWLESLRPSWKPSEEEMKALDVACSGKLWYGEIYLNGLRRIREQLKKL